MQHDSEENADLIFLVGEEPDVQRIPAHSWVLSEKSPVFRAMFKRPSFSKQLQKKESSHYSATSAASEKFGASSLSTIQSIEEDEIDEADDNPMQSSSTKNGDDDTDSLGIEIR